jgi:hypothetical protein
MYSYVFISRTYLLYVRWYCTLWVMTRYYCTHVGSLRCTSGRESLAGLSLGTDVSPVFAAKDAEMDASGVAPTLEHVQ